MSTSVLSDLNFGNTSLITGLDATEARQGVAEVATQVEVDAGLDDTRMVTPLKLAARLAALGIFPLATPVYVSATGPNVALTGAEQVIITGNITLPTGSSGSFKISYKAQVALGSALLGSNVMEFRVYVDGAILNGATTRHGWTIGGIGLGLQSESNPMSSTDLITGLADGSHTIEVRGIRTATTSTATVVGSRSLLLRSG